MLQNYNHNNFGRIRHVVDYGRVSTEHDAQVAAFDNQIAMYNKMLEMHKDDWVFVGHYSDEGITGTMTKKRNEFRQMIEDAKTGSFDLVITREVSRFARNTVDTLKYVRLLKKYGVEVYFISDNIWTFSENDEFRLTIMAAQAQEESHKTSIRVKGGQDISMDKGILYGNGNILGYDLIRGLSSADNTYKINPEQAETVKIIFDSCENGMSLNQIKYKLEQLNRKTSMGKSHWDASAVSRILNNTSYYGVLTYNQSITLDYLEKIRKKNKDSKRKKAMQFEPIITKEQFDRCQAMLDSRRFKRPTGYNKCKIENPWSNIIVCKCGSNFRRDKWNRLKDGRINYGFSCYRRARHGSIDIRNGKGLDTDVSCDQTTIAEWKLYMIAHFVAKIIWSEDSKVIIEDIVELIKSNYDTNSNDSVSLDLIEEQIHKCRQRTSNLIQMRVDGEISKDEFIEYKKKADDELLNLESRYAKMSSSHKESNTTKEISKIRKYLEMNIDFNKLVLDESIIKILFHKIRILDNQYDCYIPLLNKENIPLEEWQQFESFTITEAQAREYKMGLNNDFRSCYWNDMLVRLFI